MYFLHFKKVFYSLDIIHSPINLKERVNINV